MNSELLRRVQRYPIFFAVMGLASALALGAALALGREYAVWRRAGRELARSQRELAVVSAAAHGEAAAEAQALRLERERVMAEVFENLPEGAGAEAMPAGRIEAYADLAGFVERHRKRAAQAGVAVGAEERFGFERFAREGPALEAVPIVWRRRIELEPLLEALWIARPRSLAGVWCGEDAAPGTPPRRSVAVPGLFDTSLCRLAFVGDTGCLRRYLPALAGLARPVVVREVRAEPLVVEGRQPSGRDGTRFTLMLEVLSPGGPPVAADEGSAPVASVPVWPTPQAQSAGAGWCFEVFGPPLIEYSKDRRDWTLVGGEAAPATLLSAELELVEVRRLPYRWSLVGYGGKGGTDEGWVALEDTRVGRTVRLRRGERDEQGAIRLVEWRLVRAPGGEQVAEAKVDGRDAERWLRAGVQAPGTELAAVLREGEGGRRVEGTAGATVRIGASDYRIGAIEEAPASVLLTRLGGRADAADTFKLQQTKR